MAHADVAKEKARLDSQRQLLDIQLVEIEQIENDILSFDSRVERARKSLVKAESDFAEARNAALEARAAIKLEDSDVHQREARRAEHRLAMAERAIDSRTRRVEFLLGNVSEQQTALEQAREQVKKIEGAIAAGERKLAATARREAAQARARAAKPPVAPAITPPDRPERPEMPLVLASADTGTTQVAAGMPETAVQPAEAATEVAEPVAEVQASEVETASEAAREIAPEMLAYVQREKARIDELLGSDRAGRHTFKHLSLNSSIRGSAEFEFLGQDQYRAVMEVVPGTQSFRVNGGRFQRTIPERDAGQRYVFIFDARRLDRPRLVVYPEYVETSVGPVTAP
ncbi:hypothetical protein [Biformimicrobium ophioploci]|uniref:hypothetical protein n=1 Tax=Biformimicrobium ophioploci TaxID=3036711 RepID=UPI0025525448|nr:hypothetical protein [Microbulbifer sp. NKW57]